MENFRHYLRDEYRRRHRQNGAYSLRSFARTLGIHHATLSTLLSGKRKLTRKAAEKLSLRLSMSPEHFASLTLTQAPSADGGGYDLLTQEQFALMSEWYFDAILELSRLKAARLEAPWIARALAIPEALARDALETLVRLGCLVPGRGGRLRLARPTTTNILSPELSSAASRRHQRALLEKSHAAVEAVPRARRDHTSVTIALNEKDLAAAKEMIRDFRRDLDAFLQRRGREPDQVYQLQISLFPLTNFPETP